MKSVAQLTKVGTTGPKANGRIEFITEPNANGGIELTTGPKANVRIEITTGPKAHGRIEFTLLQHFSLCAFLLYSSTVYVHFYSVPALFECALK